MATASLTASRRTDVGKGAARKLRAARKVPGPTSASYWMPKLQVQSGVYGNVSSPCRPAGATEASS